MHSPSHMNAGHSGAEEIFGAALEIQDPEQRRSYIERACAGDEQLRQEVESLLVAHAQGSTFLEHSPGDDLRGAGVSPALLGQDVQATVPLRETSGERIGRYKLLEQIGEGGFGVVWMAEQEEPVRRRVALKIIKLGMDTHQVVARFEAERQALALMDHPNIARVFDGGATETGRPYFVMELVRGIPITEYCDAQKLSTVERLELFMQVCQAVQHAHQKGVIHRDLKPSNILVTEVDGKPVPKVIDFGVAKATQARLTEKTVFTRFHQIIGTPAYMSPEQAGLGGLDIDTRSDIYLLGVVLYELLTGRPPFDIQQLLEQGYDAILKTIREEEPKKPSTRLSTLTAEELSAVAAKRKAEPGRLNRLVRGDLDWIVMKALEKDRKRRYETASHLAADLQHYLHSEPVQAAPPSGVYRFKKLLRRQTPVSFALIIGSVCVINGIFLGLALLLFFPSLLHKIHPTPRAASVIVWTGVGIACAGVLAGALFGVYNSLQQAKGPQERAFIIRSTILSSLGLGVYLVVTFGLAPKSWLVVCNLGFSAALVPVVLFINRRHRAIREKEEPFNTKTELR